MRVNQRYVYYFMPTTNLLFQLYDNLLIYYPNVFFIVVPLLAPVLLYFLIKGIIIFFYLLYRAVQTEFDKTGVRKNAFFKKYHKLYSLLPFWVTTIRVRTSKIARRLKKAMFTNE